MGPWKPLPVEDDFKTWLSQRTNNGEETGEEYNTRVTVLGCKFGSVEELERWMRDSEMESPLFMAAIAGLVREFLVEVLTDSAN